MDRLSAMDKEELCSKCEYPLLDHQEERCLRTQLAASRLEMQKLHLAIDKWKSAWYRMREIYGSLCWHHKAIDSDVEREHYQKHLRDLK